MDALHSDERAVLGQQNPPFRRAPSISYASGTGSRASPNAFRTRPRWLIAVLPAPDFAAYLALDPASCNAHLLPLQSSLHTQLTAVGRLYGLKSAQGLSLSCKLSQELPPAVFSEEAWSIAWSPILVNEQTLPISITPTMAGIYSPVALPVAGVCHIHYESKCLLKLSASNFGSMNKPRPACMPVSHHRQASRPFILEADLPLTKDNVVPLGHTVAAFDLPQDTTFVNSPSDTAWPPTPPSPERLPSATLEDRLACSPDVRRLASFPISPPGPDAEMAPRAITRSTLLIERDWACKVRSLRECSEPSPPAHQQLFEDRRPMVNRDQNQEAQHVYPFSLYAIYPPIYPYFALYPPMAKTVERYTVDETGAVASKALVRLAVTVHKAYPDSLYTIYPSVYPHFDLYPKSGGFVLPTGRLSSPAEPETCKVFGTDKAPRIIGNKEPSKGTLPYPHNLYHLYSTCKSPPEQDWTRCQITLSELPYRPKLTRLVSSNYRSSHVNSQFSSPGSADEKHISALRSPSEQVDLDGMQHLDQLKKRRSECRWDYKEGRIAKYALAGSPDALGQRHRWSRLHR